MSVRSGNDWQNTNFKFPWFRFRFRKLNRFLKDINFFRNVIYCNLCNSIRKCILLRTKKDNSHVGSSCINYRFDCVSQENLDVRNHILFPLSKFVNSSLPFKVGLLNYLFHSVKNKIYFRSNVPGIYFSYLASFKSRIFISRI